MAPDPIVPVLEIGGTHVTAARVALGDGSSRVIEEHRFPVHAAGDAASIVRSIAEVGARLGIAEPTRWGVAIPGPFDYATGVGRFEGVAKFERLNGFDLGAALRVAMPGSVADIVFLNDATAFALGESASGVGREHRRVVCLTLGTGIGSAFVADGAIVDAGDAVPPHGWMHLLEYEGAPIEDVVSRRAMRAAYVRAAGELVDVHTIAERARAGDAAAQAVFTATMTVLGRCLAPWVERFQPGAIVVGGSIAGSWDLIAGPFRDGLGSPEVQGVQGLEVLQASLGGDAPLIGAAAFASGTAAMSWESAPCAS